MWLSASQQTLAERPAAHLLSAKDNKSVPATRVCALDHGCTSDVVLREARRRMCCSAWPLIEVWVAGARHKGLDSRLPLAGTDVADLDAEAIGGVPVLALPYVLV